MRERLIRHLAPSSWGAVLREELAAVYQQDHPDAAVNDSEWLRQDATLVVDGRWLCDPRELLRLEVDAAVFADDVPVALVLRPDEVETFGASPPEAAMTALAATRRPVSLPGTLLHFPWELIEHNREWLAADFRRRVTRPTKANLDPQTAVLGRDADVFIHPTADVDPFVVIDARQGPVWVDEEVRLQAFTRLEGPCFVGRGSQLFRANIRAGTTIGPVCRIGGEIEECIFHGYANKYHDGFLGHAYVCPWVNLGALTTNSDLKNDYSTVRVVLDGEAIETGSTKVGCFIGDHTKTAIGSFFNTGSSIGAMSLILPAGELLPKHVPPFSRIWHGLLEPLDEGALEAAISTARVAMSRRGRELTPVAEALLRRAHRATQSERAAAVDRASRRRLS